MTQHISEIKAKTVVSLFLSIAMILSGISIPATEAYGASDDSLTATKGVYFFEPHEVPDIDLTDTYVYDDNLLKGDSREYNKSLATMTYELAIASMSSQRVDYPEKSQNLRAYLEDNGFVDFEANGDYKKKMTTETMGVACAHKKIVDSGKEYTLLVIAPRSAGYEAEWGNNFVMSEKADDTEDCAGFKNAKGIILDFARSYIQKHGISGDIKVWTAGYSRGAGVTNQVAAGLLNQPQHYLGENISLAPGNLYCYTYGTPSGASTSGAGGSGTEGVYDDSKFDYIHNTWEGYDIVTAAAPKSFGFDKYGTNTGYASDEKKGRMLEMLKQTNSVVYDLYMHGGDPDKFAAKTIDVEALIESKEIKLKNDEDSYLPSSQKDFMSMMADSLYEATGGRSGYYTGNYQAAMKDFCGYFFSHMDQGSNLVSGINESKYTVPLVAFMYISYMTERYADTAFNAETIGEIKDAIAMLEKSITEMEATGEEVPQELKVQLAELRTKLDTASNWGAAKELARGITAILYSQVMGEGLTKAGLPSEDLPLYDRITGIDESKAMSRILSYLLLYDKKQSSDNPVLSFKTVSQQMKHLATFIGNSSSFMRPHNNEVILSWLRANDSYYDDFVKENTAQKSGYRRLYIEQPDGVSVTATVKDDSGNIVAVAKDGKLVSRTDSWIGVTTCDTGNWLRLPCDKTYKVDLKAGKDTKLNLKATEYSVYDGKEVRTVTSDKKYNWKGLEVKANETTTWVISAIPGSKYSIASSAYYYIEKVGADRDVLVAKGIAKGKRKAKISWNKISGAQRYVIYMSKCNTKKKKYTPKKVKTVSASKQTWTRKTLRKNKKYKFYVVAQKKVNGKYVNIAKSRMGHVITNNRSGKYTNPKNIKLSATQLTLSAGKTANIKGTVSKVKAKKKLMYAHEAKLRYTSTNPGVAKVSSGGKVTAVAAGSCRIYVQTINGMWKTVNVTVK